MPSLAVVKTCVRELLTSERGVRVTEPDLIMDDPDKVDAYTRAGREDGVMAPVYLFHCAHICEVIRPGETVVDLGCGPATQLAMVARLNPHTRFIGVDLSPEMLGRAEAYVGEQSLKNVAFRESDISNLDSFPESSVDAVVSTVALHHLPDIDSLERTFAEVARILKPDGGLYLVDFGHLKSERSISYFANQYAAQQSELFTLDYLYSLRAAFAVEDFRRAVKTHLPKLARVRSTFLMPFMVAVKSRPRTEGVDPELVTSLRRTMCQLPPHHRTDLADLMAFFRLGGLRSALLT